MKNTEKFKVTINPDKAAQYLIDVWPVNRNADLLGEEPSRVAVDKDGLHYALVLAAEGVFVEVWEIVNENGDLGRQLDSIQLSCVDRLAQIDVNFDRASNDLARSISALPASYERWITQNNLSSYIGDF